MAFTCTVASMKADMDGLLNANISYSQKRALRVALLALILQTLGLNNYTANFGQLAKDSIEFFKTSRFRKEEMVLLLILQAASWLGLPGATLSNISAATAAMNAAHSAMGVEALKGAEIFLWCELMNGAP